MPDDSQQTARLRALHDSCVWAMNAAVAEGRQDLVRALSEEYYEQSLRILAPDTGPARPRRRWGGR